MNRNFFPYFAKNFMFFSIFILNMIHHVMLFAIFPR
jgi:hypothetical protein